MDTWYKVTAIAPYVIAFFYGIAYFFKKKDKKHDDESALLHKIDSRLEQIEISMKSSKDHLESVDVEIDVHERWFMKLCEAIRIVRFFHKTYHKEDEVPLDLEKPEPIRL